VTPKEFHHLFLCIGLDQLAIDKKELESATSGKPVILLLLLDWAKKPDATYRSLADALHEHHHHTLDIEEVR